MRVTAPRSGIAGFFLVISLAGRGFAQAPAAPTPITLDQAIQLAEGNEPAFAAAKAESRTAALERKDVKAALLPSIAAHNQYLFTESNHIKSATSGTGGATEPLPAFIANNAVHEYANQAMVNETIGLGGLAAVRLADANAARAKAELEIARRGLVGTVVQLFYGVGASSQKLAVAQRALDEADRFVDITEKRESGREAAHSDVIKAHLVQQQRQRDFADARLESQRARLELGVLLYADPSTKYELADGPAPVPLPDRPSVEAAARAYSPEIKSAMASLQMSRAQTLNSWAGLLPDLALNYTYGIDAPQFASKGPNGERNLAYSASATVDFPIWDWLTSERKIKESRIRAEASKVALTAAQRRLLADLSEFYDEAETAQNELASLDRSAVDARESLRLTNLRYVNGEGTVLEVVDAQSTLVSAENAQADGMVRYRVALAQLETLTGRL
ncbi:TolC family protein [Acidobacteria bacterium AB60]|nr:TolC family protein [Acidobacteria bacterium AB60]